MNGARLQALIYSKGYAKTADKIGLPHTIYRPTSAVNPTPISNANVIGTLNAHFRVDDGLTQFNNYGKAVWRGWFDGTKTQVGDYLVGADGTYFIAAQQPLLPPLCVQCNSTINITRPGDPAPYGALGYNGGASDIALMTGWPASILAGPKGEKNEVGLPGDVKQSWWSILMPAWDGVLLTASDVMTDQNGRRFIGASIELTDMGYRITAQMANT